MAEDIRHRAADALLALIPLYYKNVIRHRPSITGIQVAQLHTLGILMKHKAMPMSEIGKLPLYFPALHDPACRSYD